MNTPHTVRPLTAAEIDALPVEPTSWYVNALRREHPRWRDTKVTVSRVATDTGAEFYMVHTLTMYALNRFSRIWELTPPRSDQDDDWRFEHRWTDQAEAFAAARRAAAELARQVTA